MNTWLRGEVVVNGLTFVYHRSGGDKPPLVLCHGITDNGLCFTRVARELEDAFDIIMVDARGHGESTKAAPEPDSHVEDLAGIVAALDLQQPEMFRQVIRSFSKLSASEALIQGKAMSPTWHDDEFPAWVESNLQVAENVIDGMALEPWQTIVPGIQCPTLLVTGEEQRGAMVTEALRRQIDADYEVIQTHQLEGAGHNIRRETFEPFVALVRSFLIP